MFIVKNRVDHPDPPVEPLVAELRALLPGIELQLAELDGDDRYALLVDMIDEDDRVRPTLAKLYDGPLDDTPDEIMRQVIRELWGEDILGFDDHRDAMTEAVGDLVRRHRVRLFDDLSGTFIFE